MGEVEGQLVGAGAQQALHGGHRHGRHHEQQDDEQHREGEALLLEPPARRTVVDLVEGGVQRAPERGTQPQAGHQRQDAGAGGRAADLVEQRVQRVLSGAGEYLLEILEDAVLHRMAGEDLPGHEQAEQRHRDDREQHVVGDHRRQPRDVGLVCDTPEPLDGARNRPESKSGPDPPAWPSLEAPAGCSRGAHSHTCTCLSFSSTALLGLSSEWTAGVLPRPASGRASRERAAGTAAA